MDGFVGSARMKLVLNTSAKHRLCNGLAASGLFLLTWLPSSYSSAFCLFRRHKFGPFITPSRHCFPQPVPPSSAGRAPVLASPAPRGTPAALPGLCAGTKLQKHREASQQSPACTAVNPEGCYEPWPRRSVGSPSIRTWVDVVLHCRVLLDQMSWRDHIQPKWFCFSWA